MNSYAKFGTLVDLNTALTGDTLNPAPVPRVAYALLTAVNAALYDEMYYAEGTQKQPIRQVAYEPIARFASKHLCCATCPFAMPCGRVKGEDEGTNYNCYKYLCNNLMVEPISCEMYKAIGDVDNG